MHSFCLMPGRTQRGRDWCFTLNNYTEDELRQLLDRCRQSVSADGSSGLRFIVVGREVGAGGTPHLQGYVEFWNARTLGGAKRFIADRAHLERRRGTSEQAYRYCTKENTFTTIGQRSISNGDRAERCGNAEKERWELARECAKSGRFDDIPADIFIRCYSSLKHIARDHMPDVADLDELPGVYIWGPAGVGKSRYAREQYPGAYLKLCNKWFDGYRGEDFIIMDDLGPPHACLAYHLKLWCDRYPFTAEIKGSALRIRPRKFIITSQYSIEEIFGADKQSVTALRRRCHVIHMDTFPPQK